VGDKPPGNDGRVDPVEGKEGTRSFSGHSAKKECDDLLDE